MTEETEETENPEEGELEPEQPETEEDSVIMRGDNLPLVDLSKFNTDGKEAHYIQINHIVGQLSGNKKITEDTKKEAKFELMLDLKSLISKTAIDPELTKVRASMRQEDTTRHNPRRIQSSIRQALHKMGTRIYGRSNSSSGGPPKTTTRYSAFRSCRHDEDDSRSENLLVAGHQRGYRKQSQRLHRLPGIR